MAFDSDSIVQRILEAYPDAVVEVAGESCNFEVYVVTDAFAGKMTLHRQRPILELFSKELRTGELHALSITAKTNAELSGNAGLVQIKM